MEKLEWRDHYLLDDFFIDREHQIFAGLINKLIQALNEDREEGYLDRVIMEIQHYAHFHFISEENYMIDLGYPKLKTHQEQHIMILEEFAFALNNLELGKKSYHDFVDFLITWFQDHTVTQDKKIVNFIKANQHPGKVNAK